MKLLNLMFVLFLVGCHKDNTETAQHNTDDIVIKDNVIVRDYKVPYRISHNLYKDDEQVRIKLVSVVNKTSPDYKCNKEFDDYQHTYHFDTGEGVDAATIRLDVCVPEGYALYY